MQNDSSKFKIIIFLIIPDGKQSDYERRSLDFISTIRRDSARYDNCVEVFKNKNRARAANF